MLLGLGREKKKAPHVPDRLVGELGGTGGRKRPRGGSPSDFESFRGPKRGKKKR